MAFLMNEWVMIPLFGISIGLVFNIWSDRILQFLRKKTFAKRDEIMRYMRLMGTSMEEKRLTLLMICMSFGLGFLFLVLLWPNVVMGLIFGSAVTVAGWYLPYLLMKNMYDNRCKQFVEQMVDALTIMANGIKAGTNPVQAMVRVVEIMPNPIAREFQTVMDQVQFGQSLEAALVDLGERIPKPDVQMFVTAINILKETGGNLAETFETIVFTIRERQKVEKKIEALTAQGLMQGMIITCMPFVLGVVFYFIDPVFVKPMFTTTLGLVLIGVMLVMQILGGIMIKKIVTIKV